MDSKRVTRSKTSKGRTFAFHETQTYDPRPISDAALGTSVFPHNLRCITADLGDKGLSLSGEDCLR